MGRERERLQGSGTRGSGGLLVRFFQGAQRSPPGARGPELGGFATDCPNAILVRVCGQPRIVAGHLWLSSGRNGGGSRRDTTRHGRDPSGRRLPGPSARTAAPAGRAEEERRSPPPAPPSSPSSSPSSSSAGDRSRLAGPPVDRVVFPLFKFRPGTKLARRGGARMWSQGPALGLSRRKSGAKEDAGRKRSLTRFELVLTYPPTNTPTTKKPTSTPKSQIK